MIKEGVTLFKFFVESPQKTGAKEGDCQNEFITFRLRKVKKKQFLHVSDSFDTLLWFLTVLNLTTSLVFASKKVLIFS